MRWTTDLATFQAVAGKTNLRLAGLVTYETLRRASSTNGMTHICAASPAE